MDKNDIVFIEKNNSKLKRKTAKLYRNIFYLCSILYLILCLASILFIIPALLCFYCGFIYHKRSKLPAINIDDATDQKQINGKSNIANSSDVTTGDIQEVKRPVYRNYDFKVVGVTFKTGRKSRQVALRKIYFHDEPYQKVTIKLEVYEYEGEEALGVFVNDFQVGNIAKEDIDKAIELLLDDYSISYTIYGGGNKNWGMKITLSKEIV